MLESGVVKSLNTNFNSSVSSLSVAFTQRLFNSHALSQPCTMPWKYSCVILIYDLLVVCCSKVLPGFSEHADHEKWNIISTKLILHNLHCYAHLYMAACHIPIYLI